ncbi:probable E3 SUMO-protein ligase RNF212 [Xenia sp. Carnegie-2017]|uniref:probable E3 SUMO-protein ligase RNF212 n=1 Tax=Xenia sp. Carnegie-2017 TaxID=2897299 RepID=UPI001F03A313|nr:probable E3 SUMO-protein ligase RNF212 [Xenia sp. Carnegie-2017]
MDWIHCNTCFVQPANNKKFFLTSCGHVFCHECIEGTLSCSSTTHKCVVCKSSCSVIPLTSNLKPEVEMYFMDPVELLKKQLKPYFQVLEFQKSHRKRLASHFQKMNALNNGSSQGGRQYADMEYEIKKLQDENSTMKKMLGVTTPRTPAGPIRLTVRTPPSNGMIGKIGTSPTGRQRSTPGIVANLLRVRADNTPGAGNERTQNASRMSSRDTPSSQMSNKSKRYFNTTQPTTDTCKSSVTLGSLGQAKTRNCKTPRRLKNKLSQSKNLENRLSLIC